ncbi:MAG: adenosylcobinamide-GDP ribazoletransferase [Nitrospirae bacterium]|nr:adenosylcobinamide-GDP ribazoletransferase [Nitrospirota bacterium]
MKQLLLALQFLTVVPMKVRGEVSEHDLVASTTFFPAAGAFQGMMLAGTALACSRLFGPEVASGLVISAYLLTNGGFDLDGFIDTFDALAVRSTGDRAVDRGKRLSAMKDSAIGAGGAIAMVMAVLLKFLLVNSLFHTAPLKTTLCVLFLMPVFSKWVTVPAMYHGLSARKDGLGRIFVDKVTAAHVVSSSLLVCVLYLAAALPYLYGVYGMASIWLPIVLYLSFYLLSLIAVRVCLGKFGGLTGDNLGALSEVSEILYLLGISLWLRHFI